MMIKPANEHELLNLARAIEGLTFQQLSVHVQSPIPVNPLQRKGWVGGAIEIALGADGGTRPTPDFSELQIELKTIPFSFNKQPSESTFVTNISLQTIHQETWETSPCYAKLKRILWIPVEGDKQIDFHQRRIGHAMLWSPDESVLCTLQNDWEELTNMIVTGHVEEIHAGLGELLQIRPKAANSSTVCPGYDAEGHLCQTLPRGFYLRTALTRRIFQL